MEMKLIKKATPQNYVVVSGHTPKTFLDLEFQWTDDPLNAIIFSSHRKARFAAMKHGGWTSNIRFHLLAKSPDHVPPLES